MQVKKSVDTNKIIIEFIGKFTFADHQNFREVISAIKENPKADVIFEASKLEFVDSAALGMILVSREEADKNSKKITIANSTGQPKKMFDLSNFGSLFNMA